MDIAEATCQYPRGLRDKYRRRNEFDHWFVKYFNRFPFRASLLRSRQIPHGDVRPKDALFFHELTPAVAAEEGGLVLGPARDIKGYEFRAAKNDLALWIAHDEGAMVSSVWLWLYAASVLVSRILLRITDVERQPFRSMGFVSVIIVSGLFLLGLPLVLL